MTKPERPDYTTNEQVVDDLIERLKRIPDCDPPPDLKSSVLRQIRTLSHQPDGNRRFFYMMRTPPYTRYAAAAAALAAAAILLIFYIRPDTKRYQPYTEARFISDSIKLARETYRATEARRRAVSLIGEGSRI